MSLQFKVCCIATR